MLAALLAKDFHLLERFFAVLGGAARRVAFEAAKMRDNELCFSHKKLFRCERDYNTGVFIM